MLAHTYIDAGQTASETQADDHQSWFQIAQMNPKSSTVLTHCSPDGPPALAIALSTQWLAIVTGNVNENRCEAVHEPSALCSLIAATDHAVMAPQPFSWDCSFAPPSVMKVLVTIVTSSHTGMSPTKLVTTRQAASGVTGPPGSQCGSVLQGRSVQTRPSGLVVWVWGISVSFAALS